LPEDPTDALVVGFNGYIGVDPTDKLVDPTDALAVDPTDKLVDPTDALAVDPTDTSVVVTRG
jgi:hypothetical protein